MSSDVHRRAVREGGLCKLDGEPLGPLRVLRVDVLTVELEGGQAALMLELAPQVAFKPADRPPLAPARGAPCGALLASRRERGVVDAVVGPERVVEAVLLPSGREVHRRAVREHAAGRLRAQVLREGVAGDEVAAALAVASVAKGRLSRLREYGPVCQAVLVPVDNVLEVGVGLAADIGQLGHCEVRDRWHGLWAENLVALVVDGDGYLGRLQIWLSREPPQILQTTRSNSAVSAAAWAGASCMWRGLCGRSTESMRTSLWCARTTSTERSMLAWTPSRLRERTKRMIVAASLLSLPLARWLQGRRRQLQQVCWLPVTSVSK